MNNVKHICLNRKTVQLFMIAMGLTIYTKINKFPEVITHGVDLSICS